MQEIERKLYGYGEKKRRIEKIEKEVREQIEKKDAFAERLLKGPRLEYPKVDGGKMGDPVYETVQVMVDVYWPYIRALFSQIADLLGMMTEVEKILNDARLTESEYRYIALRYFAGKSASKVAQEMNYSEARGRQLKKAALMKILSVH